MKFICHSALFLVLGSCVTPYNVSTEFHESLIIQGLITDQPGPYLVEISRTLPITLYIEKQPEVSGAVVTIVDDDGNSEILVEKSSGKYYTTTMQGVVGKSYTLKVITSDGLSFQSTPEKMLPIGDFAIQTPQFKLNENPALRPQITSTNGFEIFIDGEVLPEQEGRAWWRAIGTYEIRTYPERRVTPCGKCVETPYPYPCSGYIGSKITSCGVASATCYSQKLQIGPCTCCTCWVSQYNKTPVISDARFTSGGRVNNQLVYFVEANIRTFYQKYHLEVQQLSVSAAMYDFLKKLQIQQSNSSNLFQVPPPKSTGNITSTDGQVIGYFAASAMKSHVVTFTKQDLPYYLPAMDTLAESCNSVYLHSSNQKPDFW